MPSKVHADDLVSKACFLCIDGLDLVADSPLAWMLVAIAAGRLVSVGADRAVERGVAMWPFWQSRATRSNNASALFSKGLTRENTRCETPGVAWSLLCVDVVACGVSALFTARLLLESEGPLNLFAVFAPCLACLWVTLPALGGLASTRLRAGVALLLWIAMGVSVLSDERSPPEDPRWPPRAPQVSEQG